MIRRIVVFVWVAQYTTTVALMSLPATGRAQPPPSAGTIIGRIFNPAKGEYVRDANVQIPATGQAAISQDDGSYQLVNVSPGSVSILVNYTGFSPASGVVQVLGGGVSTLNFDLSRPAGFSSGGSSVVELDAFVVTDERAGNAKAIMRQRESMNIITSLASDTFGDVPDGNVATFIKNLAGVDIEMAAGVVDRTPMLRGLPGDYSQVTIDGMEPASADANSFGSANARAFIFEQGSLNSMGAVEIHKTVSADQEANAPAGTIELKSKRAFERKGRRITWLASLSAHSKEFYLGGKTYGPDDMEKKSRILPSGILEYSDVFLKQRLGVVLNLSYANVFVPSDTATITYNFSPTAADPRPAVATSMALGRSQRANETFSATFTTDFKATPNLILSFLSIYSYKDNEVRPYTVTLNTVARNTVVGTDPLLSFTSGGSVGVSGGTTSKFSESISLMPRFEYKRGPLSVEGRFMLSTARSQYEEQKRGKMRAATMDALAGVTFHAERSSLASADWQVRQLAGPDWADLSNYRNPRLGDDDRKATKEVSSTSVTASLDTRQVLPVTWKTGLVTKQSEYTNRNRTAHYNWSYNGPGGGPAGSWGAYASPYVLDLGLLGASVTSSSGKGIAFANHQSIRTLFLGEPQFFAPIATAASYYSAFVANDNRYKERVDAAFGMGTASLGKLRIRAGLRWEDTSTMSAEVDPVPASAVAAAGFPVGANGQATTIPGIDYQFLSQPRVNRRGRYEYFFPSASARYSLTNNLHAHVGYSRTIRRPTFTDVTGVFVINENTMTVTAPNPNLKPELSSNVSARLAYYFEPIGVLAIDLYEYRITGSRTTNQYTAEEFGYGKDPEFANYTFISGVSSGRKEWLRGMDIEYRQSLSFLPAPFNGLNIRASYGRNYASSIRTLLAPHNVKGGVSYRFRRFNVSSSFRWSDRTPTNTTDSRYRPHQSVVDTDATYSFTDQYSIFVGVKNAFDEPIIDMEKVSNAPAVARSYIRGSRYWSFGIKGVF